ncbi:Mitotic spindle assembly checkpoint protein MAD2A [Blattella germanica]|nr:Mitotic spindle assembly checkpoint protein MAD2A [Blattella germanica]
MATAKQQTKDSITLKGSAELVKEYLDYGINSILYQRGIYAPETFVPAEHFGITVYMTTDEKIKKFLSVVLGQIQEWLVKKKLQKISLVISDANTKEVLERWDFKIQYEGVFDILIHTEPECEIPDQWDETEACFIANSQDIRLRTFSTSLHRTETYVSYKAE